MENINAPHPHVTSNCIENIKTSDNPITDDSEFFSQYLRSFKMIFSTSHDSKDSVFVKDKFFKYRGITEEMAKFLEIGTENIGLGKSVREVISTYAPYASGLIERWEQQDLQIQLTLKRKVYLEVIPRDGKSRIFLHYKSPIINPVTNNFVGIRGVVTNIIWPHAIKALFKMHGTKGLLMGPKKVRKSLLELYPLSSVQHTILFLCINNYSYSEIALLMNEFGYNITAIRVNDYLEQLKLMFHTRTKNQLIEKAIGLGFNTALPEKLFNKISSIEVSNEEAEILAINCREG